MTTPPIPPVPPTESSEATPAVSEPVSFEDQMREHFETQAAHSVGAPGSDPADPGALHPTEGAPGSVPEPTAPAAPVPTAAPDPTATIRAFLNELDDDALTALIDLSAWAESLTPDQIQGINQYLASGGGEMGGGGTTSPSTPPPPTQVATPTTPTPTQPIAAPPEPNYDDLEPEVAAELRYLRERTAQLEQQLAPVQSFAQQESLQRSTNEAASAIIQFQQSYGFTDQEMMALSEQIRDSPMLEAQYIQHGGAVGPAIYNALFTQAAIQPQYASRIHGQSTPPTTPTPPPDSGPTPEQRRATAASLSGSPGIVSHTPPSNLTPQARQTALADALRATGAFG